MLPVLALVAAVSACAPARSAAPGLAQRSPLMRLLMKARPGQTLRLRAGTYAGNVVKGLSFSPPVTITSADPGAPAVLTDLRLVQVKGLVLEHLDFLTPLYAGPADPSGHKAEEEVPFTIGQSSDIHFRHDRFHGDPRGDLGTTGSGLMVRGSSHISVEGSDFFHLHNAFGHLNDDHLTLLGNTFHDLYDDAMRGGGTSWLTITDNHCWSNHPDPADRDHPDCIQLWENFMTKPAHDIVITDNHYERGAGGPTQFIYMEAKPELRYSNVRVTGNVGFGSAGNGITVTKADHVVIAHNRLTSACAPVAGKLIVSRLVWDGLNDADIDDNVAQKTAIDAWKHPSANVRVRGEAVTQCRPTP